MSQAKAWLLAEKAKEATCACGCGKRIPVVARHRRMGVPKYVHGHHPMGMTLDVKAIRKKGGMTISQVAKVLGMGETTIRRLEGAVYGPVERTGYRFIRVFGKRDVEALRRWRKDPKRRAPGR